MMKVLINYILNCFLIYGFSLYLSLYDLSAMIISLLILSSIHWFEKICYCYLFYLSYQNYYLTCSMPMRPTSQVGSMLLNIISLTIIVYFVSCSLIPITLSLLILVLSIHPSYLRQVSLFTLYFYSDFHRVHLIFISSTFHTFLLLFASILLLSFSFSFGFVRLHHSSL